MVIISEIIHPSAISDNIDKSSGLNQRATLGAGNRLREYELTKETDIYSIGSKRSGRTLEAKRRRADRRGYTDADVSEYWGSERDWK